MTPTVILLICIGVMLQALFIAVEHMEKYKLAVVLKGSASLMFVIVGLLGYNACAPLTFGKCLFIGLIFGMVGDILLNLRFVFEKVGQKIFLAGIAAFLVGHVLYLVGLIPMAENLTMCLLIGLLISAGLLAFIFNTMEVKKAFKIFGVVYLGAVITMTSIGVGLAMVVPVTNTVIFAIGAVLFSLSDIVLIFNTFSGANKFSMRITNLSLYYIGQLLIACNMFYIPKF